MGEDAAAGVVRFLSARVSEGGVLWYFLFLFFSFCPPARDDNFRLRPILLPPLLLYYNAAMKREERLRNHEKRRRGKTRFLEIPLGYGWHDAIYTHRRCGWKKRETKTAADMPANFPKLAATKNPPQRREYFYDVVGLFLLLLSAILISGV